MNPSESLTQSTITSQIFFKTILFFLPGYTIPQRAILSIVRVALYLLFIQFALEAKNKGTLIIITYFIKSKCAEKCYQSESGNIPLFFIIKMIIESYYGFPANKEGSKQFRRERNSQRTEKTQNHMLTQPRIPLMRTLKRTQLSKEKLNSKDSKKDRKLAPPKLVQQQISRDQQSQARMTLYDQQESTHNRQQIENMVKKYDSYKNADSYEFRATDINRYNRSSYAPQSQNREQFQIKNQNNETQNNNHRSNYDRQRSNQQRNRYHSASKGKTSDFMVHFQRELPISSNPIDRMTLNRTAGTDRMKKSKSLSAKYKPYKMHTFYNAEKRNYYNYNEEGYLTQRQYELLNKIEEKALDAFYRAAAQTQPEKKEQKKKERPPRKFQIQQNSRIQHKNSGILSDLKDQSISEQQSPSISDRKMASKQSIHPKIDHKVAQVSINSKSDKQKQYDDYQMGLNSLNKAGNNKKEEITVQKPKNMFKGFAADTLQDDSLLQFKPAKPKQVKEQIQQVKKDSQLSNQNLQNDYKSVDMMEINSNYKPTPKQTKERQQFIADDNRSLGIDTIRSHPIKKKSSEYSQKDSKLSISNSRSEDSNNESSSSSDGESKSNSHSDKRSSLPASKEDLTASKANFNKKKLTHSQSHSDAYSQSDVGEIKKPLQKIESDSSKKIVVKPNLNSNNTSLYDSAKLMSNQDSDSIEPSQESPKKLKIKRLTKKSDKNVESSQNSNSKFQDKLQDLGMQSFPVFEQVGGMKINLKPINQKNSKFQNQIQSYNQNQDESHLKDRQINSLLNSKKQRSQHSDMKPISQASIAGRSKARSNYSPSNVEYDLFGQIRDFIEQQQIDYHQTRKAKEVKELITPQLDELLGKIEDHLYIINCIAEIVLLVPDVYDFQTIYDKQKDWIFYQIFLTLKKYMFERNRVVQCLSGGKNCFTLLNYIVEDATLKKYLKRVQITNILDNMQECNAKLDKLMMNFYNFLIKFNTVYANDPTINLRAFKNDQDLKILLTEYDQQINNLQKKIEQQFNGGEIPQDEEQREMLILVNQRIFRLMEMGFIMSNMAGKQIKSYEKDQQLFRDSNRFKNYIFDNQQQFKQMIKYFK